MAKPHHPACLAATLAVAVWGPASALGAIPATGTLDLATAGVATPLAGPVAGDGAGATSAPAGDVNGDGVQDLLVGAPGASPRGRTGAGSVFVVLGASPFAPVDLGAPGPRGFRIDGTAAGDSAGRSVAAAGDVNGDGKGDILVGAVGVDESAMVTDVGAAYVVYGRTAGDVDLATLGAGGIRIVGGASEDQLGSSVASVGDVDGDGLGDLLVGASGADPGGAESGAAYLLFGTRTPKNLDAGALPSEDGIRLNGPASEATAGARVGPAGDLNGDGRPDIAIGAPFADAAVDRNGSGAVFVVLGRTQMTQGIDLGADAATTIRIDGPSAGAGVGVAFAPAGDSDGDARGELLIGVPRADPQGRTDAGEVLVVKGRVPTATTSKIDLAMAGEVFARIQGQAAGDRLGADIAPPADLTGDGKADLAIGAPGAGTGIRLTSGAVHVLGGVASVDLGAGASGVRVGGAQSGDESGSSLVVADLNKDGVADLVAGAPGADPGGRTSAGAAHLVLGGATVANGPSPVARDPKKPDTAGVPLPFVLRTGPGILVGSKSVSRAALLKAGCLRLRLQSSAVGAASVSVGAAKRPKLPPLASKSAPFLTPGFRPVCLKLPGAKALKAGTVLSVTLRMRVGTTRTSAARLVTLTK